MANTSTRSREHDRYHLTHHVISLLRDRDRGWFSSNQCALCVYTGAPEVHPQQRKRIRELLDKYVEAGILERDDTAACPLYRHFNPSPDEVDAGLVRSFEAHAASRPWAMMEKVCMGLLDQDLDKLVPPNQDPTCFTSSGKLLPSPNGDKSHYMWERLLGPEAPSALAYVRKSDPGDVA